MFGKKSNKSLDDLNSRDREDMIRRLEKERERINAEIESLLRSYSRESGNRILGKRKKQVGRLPNDYSYGENV
jgi:hypothetical protein